MKENNENTNPHAAVEFAKRKIVDRKKKQQIENGKTQKKQQSNWVIGIWGRSWACVKCNAIICIFRVMGSSVPLSNNPWWRNSVIILEKNEP